jgi:adenine-specific DNA methylase
MSAYPSQNPTALAGRSTLLEAGFPFAKVSELARADRYTNDAVYSVHKWWARRPPAVIRALLLSATLPADTSAAEFWERYRSGQDDLAGLHVGDAFLGGATSLVEGARLGAKVSGVDVDPLAVRIATEELSMPAPELLRQAAGELLAYLRRELKGLYPVHERAVPLHYFYLRRVECPACTMGSLLYRNLVIARDRGRNGAVVRDTPIVAFCPDCLSVHELGADRTLLRCCGRRRRLDQGTYAGARFTCPHCRTRSAHEQLRTAKAPRVLIAVESTRGKERRMIRSPRPGEHRLDARAATLLASSSWSAPDVALGDADGGRAGVYGFQSVADLFSNRQQAVFAAAFGWARESGLDESVRASLELGISNALTANNQLCGYAVDYGRISPLFSVIRAYAMPALSVELNPLHPSAGRGTIAATLRRLYDTPRERVRRNAVMSNGKLSHQSFLGHQQVASHVECRSADRPFPEELGKVDVMLTDPPYYDFIAYSDFSLLHRAWTGGGEEAEKLGDAPIFPVGEDPAATFARRLGLAFKRMSAALAPQGVLIFTFHASKDEAWQALAKALAASDLRVSALYPVWADARAAGGHGHPGNCELDLVFVCRPAAQGAPAWAAPSVEEWVTELGEDSVAPADLKGIRAALQIARSLSGELA